MTVYSRNKHNGLVGFSMYRYELSTLMPLYTYISDHSIVLSYGIIFQIIAILVGSMLYVGKQCASEVTPEAEVSGYEDLAWVAFGPIGKVCVCVCVCVCLSFL